jgi:cell wall assembly regulator SMI1
MKGKIVMEDIPLLWQRIERWLKTHDRELFERLRSGASQQELVQAEKALDVMLPEDFKASYQIHNGGASLTSTMSVAYLSLDEIVGTWYMYQELSALDLYEDQPKWAERPPGFVKYKISNPPPIQPLWWHPKLIPFAEDGAGNNWCVDLDPAPGGHVGQVVDWDHEDGPTKVVFTSFAALLSRLADDMEAGRYPSF